MLSRDSYRDNGNIPATCCDNQVAPGCHSIKKIGQYRYNKTKQIQHYASLNQFFPFFCMTIMMDYLMYAFGDDTNIANLLAYLSSAEEFENALLAYDQPIVKTSGGIFGIGERRYNIECSFDLNLFNILDRLQKLDLYQYIRECVHNNAESAIRIIHLLEQAMRLRTEPLTILRFFNRLQDESTRILLNFVYLFLRNIDVDHVSHAFDMLTAIFEQLECDIISTLKNNQISHMEQNEEGANDDNGDRPRPCQYNNQEIADIDNNSADQDNNNHSHSHNNNCRSNNRNAKIRRTRTSQRRGPYKTHN